MGVYLNPDNPAFRKAVNSGIYVDKSGLISYTNKVINTQQRYICMGRPECFGKTMAADMLAAYYGKGCDSGELFVSRKIENEESFLTHLNQHNVIRLDIQRFLFDESHLDIFIKQIRVAVIRELREERALSEKDSAGQGQNLYGEEQYFENQAVCRGLSGNDFGSGPKEADDPFH